MTMRILIDILHPAHVHFFRNPIRLLQEQGHEVLITSRDKDCTLDLLERFKLEHRCISSQNAGGIFAMAGELIHRNRVLNRIAKAFRPHVMTGIGGVSAAQVAYWRRIPSVVFYDTETAKLQNALTYPFASRIVVPECYTGHLPAHKTERYRGYHELSYLHPECFEANRDIALANGLALEGDTFLLRLVSWKASHDLGLKGWSKELLDSVVNFLQLKGRVIISAEGDLPCHLQPLRYAGHPREIHHLLAYCRAYIGESATMASEAVILGVPAVYAAAQPRSYVNEQTNRYHMAAVPGCERVETVTNALKNLLDIPTDELARRHRRMLDETVNVCKTAAAQIEQAGNPQ